MFPADYASDLATFTLPPAGRYLLLSDLHIGDGSATDLFGDNDAPLVALLDAHRRGERAVDAVVLDGDILDAMAVRSRGRISRAHGELVTYIDEMARRLPVYHVVGNHDALAFIDALLPSTRPCGAVRIGDEALVLHGQQFDPHFARGAIGRYGRLALGAHSLVERMTGQLIRLPFAEHDNAANRFAHWVFYRYTMGARALAVLRARLGRPDALARWAAHHDYWARSQWGDAHAMLLPVLAALATGPQRVLVTGHSHQPGLLDGIGAAPAEHVSGEPPIDWRDSARRAPAADTLQRRVYVNLGSWTFGQRSYALWRDGAIGLYEWPSERPIGDESYRIALTAAEIPGMREWWQRYYRGLLRYDIERVRADRAPLDYGS